MQRRMLYTYRPLGLKMRERTRGYKHTTPLGLRILYHQNLLKSASSASSAIIRDSDENINMPPLQGLGDGEARFYKHSVLTGLKTVLKSSRFPHSIRFGCKPNLPVLGLRRLLFLKLTLMVRLGMQVTFGWVHLKTGPMGPGEIGPQRSLL